MTLKDSFYIVFYFLGPSRSSDETLGAGPSNRKHHHYTDIRESKYRSVFSLLFADSNIYSRNFVETEEAAYIDSEDEDVQPSERSVEI